MANIKSYEDSIRHLDAMRSIVCIRIYSDKNQDQLLMVGTGIVVASEDHSCFIVTSADFIKNLGGSKKVGFVEFHDGIIHSIDWSKCITYKEIGIFDIPKHCEAVEFANEVVEGQKVFTIGYNYNIPDKRFISGNIVCGTNTNKESTQFLHGSSTGKHGHQGSAVFNEERQLVGINLFYTRSTGIDYSKNNGSDIGGLVSALDLHTVNLRLRYICFRDETKSLDQALERLKVILRQAQGQTQ